MSAPHPLWTPVRTILRREWNPIGFDELPEDEYDNYVWPIISLIGRGASHDQIADYLDWAANENMGCPVPRETNLEFALRLAKLRTGQPNDR